MSDKAVICVLIALIIILYATQVFDERTIERRDTALTRCHDELAKARDDAARREP